MTTIIEFILSIYMVFVGLMALGFSVALIVAWTRGDFIIPFFGDLEKKW